jgi:hypothetical protein
MAHGNRIGTDEIAAEGTERKTAMKAIRRVIKKFGSWVGVTLLGVDLLLVFLVHFHMWPEQWKIIPDQELPPVAFIVGLMFILSEQVQEYSEESRVAAVRLEGRVTSVVHALEERVTLLDQDISNLAVQFAPQLALNQCVEKLEENIKCLPRDSLITIHHIALDMQTAWLNIKDKIFEMERTTRRNKIKYQLLIVSGESAKLPNETPKLQAEMAEMSERAKKRLGLIKGYFDSESAAFSQVEVEIRTYTSLPFVHGISADKPEPVRYVAFSGWRGSQPSDYHWGENHYHEIKGVPDAKTSAGDVAGLFDGYFEHLWSVGSRMYHKGPGGVIPAGRALGGGV